MTTLDLTILYFATGAPFAVLYYNENRNRRPEKLFWLKLILTSIIWIPFAIKISSSKLLKLKDFGIPANKNSNQNSKSLRDILEMQKQIEKLFVKSKSNLSIYEFREAMDRYIGLTLASRRDKATTELLDGKNAGLSFFAKDHKETSRACLARRNQRLLTFHQNLALQDFCGFIRAMKIAETDKKNLYWLSSNIASVLTDQEGIALLAITFAKHRQTVDEMTVKTSENGLWKTAQVKSSLANQLISKFRTAPANSSSKD